eukprot:78401_1
MSRMSSNDWYCAALLAVFCCIGFVILVIFLAGGLGDMKPAYLQVSPTSQPTTYSPTTHIPTLETFTPTTHIPTLETYSPTTQKPTSTPTDCPDDQDTYLYNHGHCEVLSKAKETCSDRYNNIENGYRWKYTLTTNRCSIGSKKCFDYGSCWNQTQFDQDAGFWTGDDVTCSIRKDCYDDSCIDCSKGFMVYYSNYSIVNIITLLLVFLFFQ